MQECDRIKRILEVAVSVGVAVDKEVFLCIMDCVFEAENLKRIAPHIRDAIYEQKKTPCDNCTCS